jgi:hypothetical protein
MEDSMTVTDDDLLDAIRETDPARSLEPNVPALHALMRSISRRRRWRPFVVSAVLAGALALGAAIPAVAQQVRAFLAETGWFGSSPNPPVLGDQGGQSTEADQSEWIRTDSADYVAYSVSVFPDYIELPAQYDRDAFAREIAIKEQSGYEPGQGLVQKTGIVADYENYAYCAALDDWLDTGAASDVALMTEAAHWPATVSTDGGNVVATKDAVAADAGKGHRGPVIALQQGACPAIPAGALK